MKEFKDIYQLMDYIVRHHRDVLHSDTQKHFVTQQDEGMTAIDSLLRFPAVFFIEAESRIIGEPGAWQMQVTYSFSVVERSTDISDYPQIHRIFRKTKRILLEILNLLLLFKKKYPKLLAGFSLADTELFQIINMSNSQYGYMADFKITIPYRWINCEDVLINENEN